jgi:hypothetical protein
VSEFARKYHITPTPKDYNFFMVEARTQNSANHLTRGVTHEQKSEPLRDADIAQQFGGIKHVRQLYKDRTGHDAPPETDKSWPVFLKEFAEHTITPTTDIQQREWSTWDNYELPTAVPRDLTPKEVKEHLAVLHDLPFHVEESAQGTSADSEPVLTAEEKRKQTTAKMLATKARNKAQKEYEAEQKALQSASKAKTRADTKKAKEETTIRTRGQLKTDVIAPYMKKTVTAIKDLKIFSMTKKDKERYVRNYDADREEKEQLLSFLYDNGYMPKT